VAYKCLKALEAASEKDSGVYLFFDTFADMLNNDNSYIRTRGMFIISANAKWDTDNKIDEIFDKYLSLAIDEKPIVARQCIKTLANAVKHKPDLADDMLTALRKASGQRRYVGSM
jgi:hypothetical protein